MLQVLLRVDELLNVEMVLTTARKKEGETGWFIASGHRRQTPIRVTVTGRRV